MTGYFSRKWIAVICVLCILATVLCGCEFSVSDLLGKVGIPDGFAVMEQKQSHVELYGTVTCYENPNFNAPVVATFNNGLSAMVIESAVVDGVQWLRTEYGWVTQDGQAPTEDALVAAPAESTAPAETQPPAVEPEITVVTAGYIRATKLNVRTGPGMDCDVLTLLPMGTKVYVTEVTTNTDGTWGLIDMGWISMDYVYYPGEVGKNTAYAVVREGGATVYQEPLGIGFVKELSAGMRVHILEQLDMDGNVWGYTEGGWVYMGNLYVES